MKTFTSLAIRANHNAPRKRTSRHPTLRAAMGGGPLKSDPGSEIRSAIHAGDHIANTRLSPSGQVPWSQSRTRTVRRDAPDSASVQQLNDFLGAAIASPVETCKLNVTDPPRVLRGDAD